jgi:hypothetical protein
VPNAPISSSTNPNWSCLKTLLARLVSQHTASSELLLWLAKERSDAFADILGSRSAPFHVDRHGTGSIQ